MNDMVVVLVKINNVGLGLWKMKYSVLDGAVNNGHSSQSAETAKHN